MSEIIVKGKYKDTWDKPFLPPVDENELKKYPFIKKNGESLYYMPKIKTEEQIKTYLQFRLNPILFIENVLTIDSGSEEGKVDFNLYPQQKQMIEGLYKFHQLVILKSRQIGWSTLWGGLIVYGFTFFSNWTAGIVSITQTDSSKFLRKHVKEPFQLGSQKYPYLFPRVDKWDSLLITNELKTSVSSFTTTKNVGRGSTFQFTLIDEAAFIRYIDEFMTAVYPAMTKQIQNLLRKLKIPEEQKTIKEKYPAPTGFVINTTPNGTRGLGKWFYNFWVNASKENEIREKYKNGELTPEEIKLYKDIIEYPLPFVPYKVHWSDIGDEYGFTEEWYKFMINSPLYKGQELKIKRELDLVFVDEEPEIFPKNFLPTLERYVKQFPPVEIKYQDILYVEQYVEEGDKVEQIPLTDENGQEIYIKDSGLRIFEQPTETGIYILGVDPAGGRSKSDNPDSSAITVIDLYGKVVAQYKSTSVSTSELAEIIYKIGNYYNEGLVIIERNSMGISVIVELVEKLRYGNLYYYLKDPTSTKELNDLQQKLKTLKDKSTHAGFSTRGVTREEITIDGKLFLIKNKDKIRNELFVDELFNLTTDSRGRIVHKPDTHDDLFMSFCLSLKARKDYYRIYYDDSEDTIQEKEKNSSKQESVFRFLNILTKGEIARKRKELEELGIENKDVQQHVLTNSNSDTYDPLGIIHKNRNPFSELNKYGIPSMRPQGPIKKKKK